MENLNIILKKKYLLVFHSALLDTMDPVHSTKSHNYHNCMMLFTLDVKTHDLTFDFTLKSLY